MEIEEIKKLLEEKKFNILKNELKQIKAADIPNLLEELEKEKGIKKDYVIEAIETALVTAYKRNFDAAEKIAAEIRDNGGEAIAVKTNVLEKESLEGLKYTQEDFLLAYADWAKNHKTKKKLFKFLG